MIVRRRSVLGISAVALLSFSSVSQAQQWYVQGAAGYSKADQTPSRLVEQLPSGTLMVFDDSDTSYGVAVGYQLHENVAVEMGYQDLGAASTQISGDTLNPAQYHELVKTVSPVLVDGWTLATRFTLWQNEQWELEVPLGVLHWDSEIESTRDQTTLVSTRSATDWFLGMQLNYQLSEDWKLGLGYQQFDLKVNDVNSWWLSLRYEF